MQSKERETDMDIKKLHPIILIGEGLGEKYKALPIGEKKKVAILSDIEMSNIPASLSHKRNISKNTLRRQGWMFILPFSLSLPDAFNRNV